MNWDSFIRLVADLPLFDVATAVQMAGKDRPRIRVQLHRWSKAGKVIRLRRGLYALAEPYRKARLSALRIANEMYQPSYLSRLWALGHYGLVPEAVAIYQSATTRLTRGFDNAFGSFAYSSLKQDFFWGFTTNVRPLHLAQPVEIAMQRLRDRYAAMPCIPLEKSDVVHGKTYRELLRFHDHSVPVKAIRLILS